MGKIDIACIEVVGKIEWKYKKENKREIKILVKSQSFKIAQYVLKKSQNKYFLTKVK